MVPEEKRTSSVTMVGQVKNINGKKKKKKNEYAFYTYVNLELFLNHSGHRDNWLL